MSPFAIVCAPDSPRRQAKWRSACLQSRRENGRRVFVALLRRILLFPPGGKLFSRLRNHPARERNQSVSDSPPALGLSRALSVLRERRVFLPRRVSFATP